MQKVAKYYALICDETKDISCVEQACLVLRYVIDDKPTKRFMGYKPLGVTNAETITEILKSFVSELGLSLFDCRGQSYYGAAVMSGKCSGVQPRSRQLEPRVLFVVCNSDALNIIVVDSCRTLISATCLALYSRFTHYLTDKMSRSIRALQAAQFQYFI